MAKLIRFIFLRSRFMTWEQISSVEYLDENFAIHNEMKEIVNWIYLNSFFF